MAKILIGFVFAFFDFNLNLDYTTIELVPDFIGWILIAMGLGELSREKLSSESMYFSTAQLYSVGMAIWTAICFVKEILGYSSEVILLSLFEFPSGWLVIVLSIVATFVMLYIMVLLVRGIEDIENRRQFDLNSGQLRKFLIPMILMNVIALLSVFIFPILALLCAIGAAICNILFLIQLNTTRILYQSLPTEQEWL